MKLKVASETGNHQEPNNQIVVIGASKSNGVWGSHFIGWKKCILWIFYISMFGGSFALVYFSKDLPKWRVEFVFAH